MSLIAKVSHPLKFSERPGVRKAFKDGQIAAACGHREDDCPHHGRRSKRATQLATLKRQAWLEGHRAQIKASGGQP